MAKTKSKEIKNSLFLKLSDGKQVISQLNQTAHTVKDSSPQPTAPVELESGCAFSCINNSVEEKDAGTNIANLDIASDSKAGVVTGPTASENKGIVTDSVVDKNTDEEVLEVGVTQTDNFGIESENNFVINTVYDLEPIEVSGTSPEISKPKQTTIPSELTIVKSAEVLPIIDIDSVNNNFSLNLVDDLTPIKLSGTSLISSKSNQTIYYGFTSVINPISGKDASANIVYLKLAPDGKVGSVTLAVTVVNTELVTGLVVDKDTDEQTLGTRLTEADIFDFEPENQSFVIDMVDDLTLIEDTFKVESGGIVIPEILDSANNMFDFEVDANVIGSEILVIDNG